MLLELNNVPNILSVDDDDQRSHPIFLGKKKKKKQISFWYGETEE